MTKQEFLAAAAVWRDRLFVLLQLAIPTLALSTLVYHVTRLKKPVGLKNALIRGFMRLYKISLEEAEMRTPEAYDCFNDFFTRSLRHGVRPLDANARALLCPVDGQVSQIGDIEQGRIFQAKGHDYSAAELLGGEDIAAPFMNGRFATIYLAPHNYHRVHMPVDGTLKLWTYVPGRLFSVNAATVRELNGVFARNERIGAVFQTPYGPLAMVLVGALNVGSLETVWAGRVTPPHNQPGGSYIPSTPVKLARGLEMGRFNMGSTVILLTGPGMLNWNPGIQADDPVRMGQALGLFSRR